jgi:hypothetical protein
MPKSPVFIVGSPRSGTSVLVIALTRAGYQGYHEGNFLPLMMSVGDMVDRYFAGAGKKNPKVLAAHVDPALLKSRLQDVFRTVTQELNTGPYWFDKSGNHEMIRAVPILRRLWPESVFIFAKRRGIENLVSRTKKFPTRDFEYHCVDWAKNMSTWREVRAQLPNDTYAEVDQRDLRAAATGARAGADHRQDVPVRAAAGNCKRQRRADLLTRQRRLVAGAAGHVQKVL